MLGGLRALSLRLPFAGPPHCSRYLRPSARTAALAAMPATSTSRAKCAPGAATSLVSDDFLRRLPKTDLHVHLDGSLRIETLLELARSDGIQLPATTVEGLREKVFLDNYANLDEYLAGFQYTTAVMRNPDSLERIAYEFAMDNYNESVHYFEVRFAPQLLASATGMSIREVLERVHIGLNRATKEANANLGEGGVRGTGLRNRYGIIVCAMRWFNENFSDWYRDFMSAQGNATPAEMRSAASTLLVEQALISRDTDGVPIVALDIAGAETLGPATEHKEAFAIAHANLLGKTVHAGEAMGRESIKDAVVSLFADRIGHGFHLFSPPPASTSSSTGTARGKSCDTSSDDGGNVLANHISRRRITLEVCIKSNLQTMPELGNDPHKHQIKEMVERGVEVSICTDNRLVSNTSMVNELGTAVDVLGLDQGGVKRLVKQGAQGIFFPGSGKARKEYLAAFERCIEETN